MAKYRIVEHKLGDKKGYTIEERVLFFFWSDVGGLDMDYDGWHETYKEAKEELDKLQAKSTRKVVFKT